MTTNEQRVSDPLVTITTYTSIIDAELARGALEAAGIEAVLANAEIGRIHPGYSRATRGVRLRVRREDALRAGEVLDSECRMLEEFGEADEPVAEPELCRACGSSEVARRARAQVFLLFAVTIFGVGLAVGFTDTAFLAILIAGVAIIIAGRARCSECGESWN